MSLLHIENLSAAYGASNVLHEIVLAVGVDEIVTLIGANGAGKSTTLLSISGLVKKTGGKVVFADEDISTVPAHSIVNRGIIHIPEGRGIFPRLTVDENLRMGAFSVGEVDEAVMAYGFSLFPVLQERRRQMGGTLSGGEQQMLAIARGLMAKPKLLLLDEPSLGVAPILVERIFAALREIHKTGVPILLVEQNAKMALGLADRGYVIENGKIILEGTGDELLNNPEVMTAYLGI